MSSLLSSSSSTVLLDMLLKGVGLLVIAHLAGTLLRRWTAPATLRRAIWGVTFALLLTLPLGSAVLPQSSLPDTISPASHTAEQAATETRGRPPSPSSEEEASRVPMGREAAGRGEASVSAEESNAVESTAPASSSASEETHAEETSWGLDWTWKTVLIGIWGVGAALLLLRLSVGLLRTHRLRETAQKAEAAGWNELLNEIQKQIGSQRDVDIRFHDGSTPMAVGVFSPTILLPASARTWPTERRRLVLLHEMTHLHRRDLLLGLLGQFGRALHWPNPLAWTGWSAFERARETACDEAVLDAGEDPHRYARQLLAAARRAITDNAPAPALQIARPTRLRERILSIIDQEAAAAWSSGRKALLGGLLLALMLPVMAVRPFPSDWYPRTNQSEGASISAVASAWNATIGGSADPDPRIQNLRAFAKLYGYVRYFHPSDAAAKVNWDKFAVHGVRQVKNAGSRAELRFELEALFEPIAPTVKLYRTGIEPPPPADVLTPPDTTGLHPVAWQHEGLGRHSQSQMYNSVRVNAAAESDSGSSSPRRPFAWATQRLDAEPFQGKQVQLRAAVRTADRKSTAHLYLYASADTREPLSDPISSRSWSTHKRTITVPSGATRLQAGPFVQDPGTAWFDDVELFVRDSPDDAWSRVPLENAGFESGNAQWRLSDDYGSQESVTGTNAYSGRQSLKLTVPPRSELRLLDEHPRPGETIETPLGRGLSAQVPIALHNRDGHTLRPDEAPSPATLQARLDSLDRPRTGTDVFLANVVAAWNVFQHFYPYFDVVDTDWDQALTQSLRWAQSDRSNDEFRRTLRRLLARLQDGHAGISSPHPTAGSWPLLLDRADGEVVVTDTVHLAGIDKNVCPEIGDVLVSVDGTPIEETVREAKRYISGSAQYRDVEALQDLGRYVDSPVSLVLRRDGKRVECRIQRRGSVPTDLMQTAPRPDSFEQLEAGTYYVDLTRLPWTQLKDNLEELSRARRVIFDMRGYPEGGNHEILQHLSSDTLRSAHFEVPQRIYPDRQKVAGYTGSRWTLPPKSPQLTGKVAFLTDARAISYAESVMGIVEHYDLGTIVGQPTAGTNGNVNRTTLIDYQIRWTGMRVQKHDRSQHHLVGIRPDVEAIRTLEGVRSGKDEVLRKALQVLE